MDQSLSTAYIVIGRELMSRTDPHNVQVEANMDLLVHAHVRADLRDYYLAHVHLEQAREAS